MKAKRKFNIWLWVLLCVPCLLASCDHDVHNDEEEGGLSVSLTWADEADQGTEVKDVKLWIFNANDGSLVEEKHDGSAQEVASQRFQLPGRNLSHPDYHQPNRTVLYQRTDPVFDQLEQYPDRLDQS